MAFYQHLNEATRSKREQLLAAPIINRALRGDVSLDEYVSFLCQAYHHVKQTVPLLMATGARLPESHEWLREAVAEYIEEETGHQEWILDDIRACGFDAEYARSGRPALATELMVAYAWDTVQRVNPLGFFGMVLVLEGTSIALADHAARAIRERLKLPAEAFRYLTSHGALDQEHIRFFAGLMDRITNTHEQQVITHAANVFYQLYGDIFRQLTAKHGLPALQQSGLAAGAAR